MRVYATEEDLTEWAGAPVDLAVPLLRAASALVEDSTVTALYAVDDEGYPADTTVREAFRTAVCAQAVAWDALGIDPRKGTAGVTQQRQVTGKSLGSATLSYSTPSRSTDDLVDAVHTLAEQAATILRGALPHDRIGVTG